MIDEKIEIACQVFKAIKANWSEVKTFIISLDLYVKT